MPAAVNCWVNTADKRVLRAATGAAVAAPQALLFDPLAWRVSFRDGDTGIELPEGSTVQLVLKKPLEMEADARLLIDLEREDDDTFIVSGLCDSTLLRTDIAGFSHLDYSGQFFWQEPEAEPERSLPFQVRVFNSPRQPTETAPVAGSDAWWTKLKDSLEAGENIELTPNEGTKKILVEATGGGASITVVNGRLRVTVGSDTWQWAASKVSA